MIKKVAVSIMVPERLVREADYFRTRWGQSRAFVMTRWLLEGCGVPMTPEELVEYFPRGLSVEEKAQSNGKNRGVGAGEAQDLVGVSGSPDPVFDGGTIYQEPFRPPPVFRTDLYLSKPENDFPVVGVPEVVTANKMPPRDPHRSQRVAQSKKKSGTFTVDYREGVGIAGPGFPVGQGIKQIKTVIPVDPRQHDPDTCTVYGCLMCKAAKEGK